MSTAERHGRHRSGARVLLGRCAGSGALHLALAAIGLTMVLPFTWMVLTSLKDLKEVGLPNWLPAAWDKERT